MNDILDLHTHTIASGHAYNTLYEMAQSASEKGLQLFGSSDHGPAMPGASHEFYFINFKVIPRRLFGVSIMMGAELNILDENGSIDLQESVLKTLDYTIASIHQPCYSHSSVSNNTNAYLGVMKNPYVNIIGHPDDSRFPYDYDILASAAKEHHKLLEVNNSSLNPKSFRQNTKASYYSLLECCKKYKTPIIINSDAHLAPDVANHEYVWELLNEIQFPAELIVNQSLDLLSPYIRALADIMTAREGEDD